MEKSRWLKGNVSEDGMNSEEIHGRGEHEKGRECLEAELNTQAEGDGRAQDAKKKAEDGMGDKFGDEKHHNWHPVEIVERLKAEFITLKVF